MARAIPSRREDHALDRHDVIIVGARCSGATLAALLARNGLRVLLLEASPRGTDMPMSTHFVQPAGMKVLDSIGIGERVRKVTPPTGTFRLALDGSSAVFPGPPNNPGYCIRRSTIDPWLQDTAEEAGAELLDGHRVVGLLRDRERVTGVVARGPRGNVELRAELVVGADGLHSTVAKLTKAPEYLVTEEGSRAAYWAYYRVEPGWSLPWDSTLEHIGKEIRYVFRCNDDVVVLIYAGEKDEVRSWGKSYREKLADALSRSETTRRFSEGKEPVGDVLGILKTRFFYREPVGPGYALLGDAGHFKDFVTGQGMADAFLDAERLSRAILDGRPEAFTHYWRERDVATLPLHFDAVRQGEIGYNGPFMRCVLDGIAARPDILSRVALVMERSITPGEMIPMSAMLGFMGRALLRGRLDVLSGFLKMGGVLRGETQEMERRKALLAEAAVHLASPAPATRARVAA